MEAAVVSALVSPLTKTILAKLLLVLEKKYRECKGFEGDILFIQGELGMIASAMVDQLTQKGVPSAVQRKSMEVLRDLEHNIEDCLDRFLPCAACEGEASFLDRPKMKGTTNSRFAEEIKRIRGKLKDAHERIRNYNVVIGSQSTVAGPAAASSGSTTTTNTDTTGLQIVGIEEPKRELLELLEHVNGQPEQLKVISIVGFGGTGKTTLARAVYACPDFVRQFRCHAWVVASEHKDNTMGLLSALLEELRPGDKMGPAHSTNVQQLQTDIRKCLNDKRYLIVLDDIEEQQWDCIKSTFPERTISRIIVTTTIQAVAKVCTRGNGYVYNMRSLDVKHSKDLLEAAFPENSPELEEQSSTLIVDKCDGHPLALVSVANFLQRRNVPTDEDCEEVCRCLGYNIENGYDFKKLRQVLMNNYSSLRSYPLKTCLLYLCVFPNGRPIRRNNLFRRWLAEGYVQGHHPLSDLEVARKYFRELIDRNIIRPIDASKNGEVKTCRTHGIMHEYMLHKSLSGNFITSRDNSNRSKFRHIFIQNPTNGASSSGSEKFCARSLTISGNAGEAVSDLAKCELLRVLDLEECNDLEEQYLINVIHKLRYLKYLSLGSTVSSLPKEINKLHCLETIDLRKTKIEILPGEVMTLPHLAHLFGKIKRLKRIGNVQRSFPAKSNLHTLSGFVVDNNSAFPELMSHMKKLGKVKIWCGSTAAGSAIWVRLLEPISKFIQDDMDTADNVRSLSLYLEDSLEDFITLLENFKGYHGTGCIRSLKLHGKLSSLPQFVTSLCGLTDLCLSSRKLMGAALSNLRELTRLRYLKLVQDNLKDFRIKKDDFKILRRLCLVVQTPTLPTIEKGALQNLIWLQLLCQKMEDLCGMEIESFNHLQEVALDCMVQQETIEIWRNAAKNHPKRPRVLLLKRVDPTEAESIVKFVSAEGTVSQLKIPEVQSRSIDGINSALEKTKLSAPPPASAELSGAGVLGMA